jgi:chromosome segregation ATPase
MPNPQSAVDRLSALKAQIKELENSAVAELTEKRNSLREQIAEVDDQLASLTGKPAGEKSSRRRRAAAPEPRNLPLQELKQILAEAPDRTLNIRRENLDLRNIKVLAEANPTILRIGGKGAWPTVTLLK